MFKEYKPRETTIDKEFKFTVCECSHIKGVHDGSLSKGKCELCECPKYTFYKMMTNEERRKEEIEQQNLREDK